MGVGPLGSDTAVAAFGALARGIERGADRGTQNLPPFIAVKQKDRCIVEVLADRKSRDTTEPPAIDNYHGAISELDRIINARISKQTCRIDNPRGNCGRLGHDDA
jgi:hypothetical protein